MSGFIKALFGEGAIRVLIVEDNADYLGAMMRALAQEKELSVCYAEDAQRARFTLERIKGFDCLLIDVHLRGKSGIALAELCRDRYPNVAIILNTADPQEYYDDPRSGLADACLEKTSFATVADVIRNVVWRKKMSAKVRALRFSALSGDLMDCVGAVSFKRTALDDGGAEVFEGVLGDNKLVTCVAYDSDPPVGISGAKRFTACLSSSVGCGGDCRFCCVDAPSFDRNLTANEMIAQFLYTLKGYHAIGAFERLIEIRANWAYVGDPLMNLHNVCEAIGRIELSLSKYLAGISYILTTPGNLNGLTELAEEYGNLSILLCLSVHFRPRLREQIMPGTRGQYIDAMLGILFKMWEKSQRVNAMSWALAPELNGGQADVDYLAERFANNPAFQVKVTGMRPCKLSFTPASNEQIREFGGQLSARGVSVRVKEMKHPWVPTMKACKPTDRAPRCLSLI